MVGQLFMVQKTPVVTVHTAIYLYGYYYIGSLIAAYGVCTVTCKWDAAITGTLVPRVRYGFGTFIQYKLTLA